MLQLIYYKQEEITIIICKVCGNESKEGAKFCTECGEPYEEKEVASLEQRYSPNIYNFQKLTYFLEANIFTATLLILFIITLITFNSLIGWLMLIASIGAFYIGGLSSKGSMLSIESKLRSYIFKVEDIKTREINLDKLKEQIKMEQEQSGVLKEKQREEELKYAEMVTENKKSTVNSDEELKQDKVVTDNTKNIANSDKEKPKPTQTKQNLDEQKIVVEKKGVSVGMVSLIVVLLIAGAVAFFIITNQPEPGIHLDEDGIRYEDKDDKFEFDFWND